MAGLEQLVVHSKAYLVRWIEVPAVHTIAWTIQPQKKSLNFGVFRHPGPGQATGARPSSAAGTSIGQAAGTGSSNAGTPRQDSIDDGNDGDGTTAGSSHVNLANTRASTIIEKLQKIGLVCVVWAGRCEADRASTGNYEIPEGAGGMYGFVFDNTFSKQLSKNVTFVSLTYPSNAPPKSGHVMMGQALAGRPGDGTTTSSDFNGASSASTISRPRSFSALDSRSRRDSSAGRNSPTTGLAVNSTESLAKTASISKAESAVATATTGSGLPVANSRPRSSSVVGPQAGDASVFFTGVLHKKRRKRNQGYARRFFSLDFTSSTLSYYHDRNSFALRGAIPLALAAMVVNEKKREITIDSGAEVWHLRASNSKEYVEWCDALERASASAEQGSEAGTDLLDTGDGAASPKPATPSAQKKSRPVADEAEWRTVEALLGRLAGTRDALKRITREPDSASTAAGDGQNEAKQAKNEGQEETAVDERSRSRRRPFWRRKESAHSPSPSSSSRRSTSAHQPSSQLSLALSSPTSSQPAPSTSSPALGRRKQDGSLYQQHCQTVLSDLDSVVTELAGLLARRRQRNRQALGSRGLSRISVASGSSDEYFDADEGATISARSQSRTIKRQGIGKGEGENDDQNSTVRASDDSSGPDDDDDEYESVRRRGDAGSSLFPSRPKSLEPLPIKGPVQRRTTVPAPKVPPPSLVSFLRKNMKKDLSTVSMPVSANEPISLLQRLAEQLEYSELLDAAAAADVHSSERILRVAAFAVSTFSSSRVKERATRKPFNPMLGETYELVREDKGFRLMSEKISHHPIRMACQAESANWTLLQSPRPIQEFWGKSAELNTDGRVRIAFHTPSASTGSAQPLSASASSPPSSTPSVERYSWAVATSFLRNVIAGEKYVEPVGTMTIINETTGAKATVTFKSGGMFAGRSEDVRVDVYDPDGGQSSAGLVGKWISQLASTSNQQQLVWKAGPLVDDSSSRYGYTEFTASLNEITAVERRKGGASAAGGAQEGLALPPTDSRLRPDQRAVEDGRLDEAETIKARLEDGQRARRSALEQQGQAWQPRWFVKASSGGPGDDVWRLKDGKDGYWDRRVRGDWAGVTPLFD